MNMMPISDVLIVKHSGSNPAESMTSPDKFQESVLELFRVSIHKTLRVLAKDLHLPLMAFTHAMAFEAVFVSALLLAHLAIPSEFLQALSFDAVSDGFGGEEVVLAHGKQAAHKEQRWRGEKLGPQAMAMLKP